MATHHPTGAGRRSAEVEHQASGLADERGVVLIMVSLCLAVIVTAVALTIDIGRLMATARDLQGRADSAALDVSRRLDGGTRSEVMAAASDALAKNLERNGFPSSDATLDLGWWDQATGTWTSAGAEDVPTAARVELNRHVDFAFAPGGRTTTRTAVAASGTDAATICIGSLADSTIDTAVLDRFLVALLGPVTDPAALRSIAGTEVGLGDLLVALGIDPSEPGGSATSTFTISELMTAFADAADAGGDPTAASVLDGAAAALADPDAELELGDAVAFGSGAGPSDGIRILDAVVDAAIGTRGTEPVELAGLDSGSAELGPVDVSLTFDGGPRCHVGARSGEMIDAREVTATVTGGPVALDAGTVALDASVEATGGEVAVEAVACLPSGRLRAVAESADVLAEVAFDLSIEDPAEPGNPRELILTGSWVTPAESMVIDQQFPPGIEGEPAQWLGGGPSAAGVVLEPPPPDVLDPEAAEIRDTRLVPMLDPIDSAVLHPLLVASGASAGGAPVTPLELTCGPPKLVG